MTGGLFDPLGTGRPDLSDRAGRPPASVLVAGLVLAALTILVAVSWLRDDGDRGRPVAVAPIEHVQAPPRPPAPPQPAIAVPAPAAAATTDPAASSTLPPVRDDQEVEIQNGVRIVRPRRDAAPAAGRTIRVPDAGTPR